MFREDSQIYFAKENVIWMFLSDPLYRLPVFFTLKPIVSLC